MYPNYRIHRRLHPALLLPLMLAVFLCPLSNLATAQAAPTPGIGDFDVAGASQLVALINQARAEAGLAPLAVDHRLTSAAQKHTQLMVEHAELAHQFDGEPSMQQRFAAEEMPSDEEAENVAFNQTVAGAHQGLMASPLHRQNILDPSFNTVGVAILHHGINIYVTEDFARRLPEYSPPQAEEAVQRAIDHEVRSAGMAVPVRVVELRLRRIACDMPLQNKLSDELPLQLPGVHEVMTWTVGDPGHLPDRLRTRLRHPMPSGYSLGACFAPSVSHPGGVYWIVVVIY